MVKYIVIEKARNELHTYRDPKELTRDLEPVDVAGGIYRAYNQYGNLVHLSVKRVPKKILGFIPAVDEQIIITQSDEKSIDGLKEDILNFAKKHNIQVKSHDLEQMLQDLGDI